MTNSRSTTSARTWRKRTGGVELSLPSGNTCLVKRPGMDKLLSAGILPDSLTPIAMEHLRQAESGGKPPSKEDEGKLEQEIMEQVLNDPSQITEIFASFDRVTAMCVVEPKVELHFREGVNEDGEKFMIDIPAKERLSNDHDEMVDGESNPYWCAEEDEPLYTDDIDEEDKQHIFQFVVGGSSDLEPFRSEPGSTVAAAQPRQDLQGPPV